MFWQVYRSSHPGLGVRVYHMVFRDSCEEHKYLAAIRKEKESFERLIKERGVCGFHLNVSLMLLLTYCCIDNAIAHSRRTKRRSRW